MNGISISAQNSKVTMNNQFITMSEQQLLGAFSSALGDADNESTFACGGHIPVILSPSNLSENSRNDIKSQVYDQVITTKRVTIRYGPYGQGEILRLPTNTTNDPAFLNLISTCEPATFGRGGKDVYDEQYRKAIKLDTDDFLTDFSPYETGIIDIVQQLLMPSVKRKVTETVPGELQEITPAINADAELLHAAVEGSSELDSMTLTEILTSRSPEHLSSIMKLYMTRYQQGLDEVLEQRLEGADLVLLDILAEAHSSDDEGDDSTQSAEMSLGIRAELYKLNIYSRPSGKFKAHVDTPRSETQIGSLVVCLPSEFEGGVLSVSHQANTVKFDWSASSSTNHMPCIQWAAFYSDCSHEVQEVTAGHRVTLTYDLYASRGSGSLAGKKHSMDAARLPTYQPLVDLLRSCTFMVEGGSMAIGLAHAYPYTHALLHRHLPGALKGADMMLYEVLLALNLRAELVRVMDLSEEYADMRDRDAQFHNSDASDNESCDGASGDTFYQLGFEPMKISDEMIENYDLVEKIGWDRLGPVLWIRHPRDSQLEMAYLAYGNEASMVTKYSSAAIVVSVPTLQQRLRMLANNAMGLST
ncbi:hypothetical protein KCU81_g9046, partial [Aureobasidium melanogenum]